MRFAASNDANAIYINSNGQTTPFRGHGITANQHTILLPSHHFDTTIKSLNWEYWYVKSRREKILTNNSSKFLFITFFSNQPEKTAKIVSTKLLSIVQFYSLNLLRKIHIPSSLFVSWQGEDSKTSIVCPFFIQKGLKWDQIYYIHFL